MESWRRYKGDNYNQQVRRETSYYRKPPIGNWRPTVPSWEKQFCISIGKVPWGKILDAKKSMHYYGSIVKWNDSAGEEAFNNAKSQFYAKINGLPCEIPMPDPDQYIDEIDWDCKIDPELIQDLECEHVDPDADADKKDGNVVIFGDSLLANQGFSSTGWGDCEDDVKGADTSSNVNNGNSGYPWDHNCSQNTGVVEGNGWEDFGNNSWCWYNNSGAAMGYYGWGAGSENSGWEHVSGNNGWGEFSGNNGWGDGWNNSWGWYQYGSNYVPEYVQDTNGVYGTWSANNGQREGTENFMPRHKASKFHGNDYQRNHQRRNANNAGKRASFVPEKPMTDGKTASKGNFPNSCAPATHQASDKGRHRWSMEKPVSQLGN